MLGCSYGAAEVSHPCTIPGAHDSETPFEVPGTVFDSLKHLKVQRIIQSLSKLIRSFLPGLRFGKFTKLEATCMRFLLLLGFAGAEA